MIFLTNRKWPPRKLTHPRHKYCSRNYFLAIFVSSTVKPMVIGENMNEKYFWCRKNILKHRKIGKKALFASLPVRTTHGTYQNNGIALSSCDSTVLMKV